MLVKQGRQIRALYELQKSTFEKVTSIQSQLKKTNKNIELSSKVFSVSNNLITDNNIIIILVITFRYLTVWAIYRYITKYRMDMAQYAMNFSPRICGQNTKNIRSHWSGGSMRTIQVISGKLGIQSGWIISPENTILR